MPTLAVVLVFQVAQRWMNFAIANPARQVFFTVVDREEKYKAKNLIDVVDLSRLRRALRLGVRQPADDGPEARRDRACRGAGRRRRGWPVGALGRAQERRAEASWRSARQYRAEYNALTDATHGAILPAAALAAAAASRLAAFAQVAFSTVPAAPITRRDPRDRRAAAGGRPRHRARSSTLPMPRPGKKRARWCRRSSKRRQADRHRSTYGDAERVLGERCAGRPARQRSSSRPSSSRRTPQELKRSLSRLRPAKLDLLQLHNVRDPRQSLAAFKAEWKAQGVCRYIGITSTFHGAFPAIR